jgi:cytochrome P450
VNLLDKLSLIDPAVMEDPYPYFKAIHDADARVIEVPGVGYWVGRMNDVRALSRDTETFSNSYFSEGGPLPTGVNPEPLQDDVRAIFADGPEVVNALWTTDPPIHSLHRKLVNKAFTVRWVESQERGMRQLAHHLIDGFVGTREVEFIHDYAVKIPLIVIADALGVSRDDIGTFRRWSDDILAGNLDVLTHERRRQVATSFVEATRYFADTVVERRREPKPDLISSLATAEVDGRRLEIAEILPIISTVLLAGNETTANLIGNGMSILLDRPELLRRLVDDPEQIPAFLEEVLRYEGPVHCLYRVVTQDTEVAGVKIPQGSNVMLGWGSAGRDPDWFAEPDEFNMDRDNAKQHVGFGFGPHLCVGSTLARAEARVAFEVLFERLENFALKPETPRVHVPTHATRGLQRLEMTFTDRAAVGKTF